MKYAVFKTGGKQYKVSEGDIIEVEKLNTEPNKDYSFDKVFLYVSDDNIKIGTPFVKNAKVMVKILDNIKGGKIRVAKYKSKVRYRRVYGHRQALTKVQIKSIKIAA